MIKCVWWGEENVRMLRELGRCLYYLPTGTQPVKLFELFPGQHTSLTAAG